MLVQTITGDLLSKLRDTGIKEQTIRKHYACFYRSFCKEAGDKELGIDLIVSFLLNTREKDIWNLPYYQLSRREQICRNAFHVLLEYQITGRLEVKTRRKDALITKDETVMNEYVSLCVEAGNAERTYIRKKAAIRRFLTVSSLEDINSAAIQSYVYSFAGKSTYYQKRELDEIRKFLGFCFLQKYICDDFGTEFPDIRAVKDSRLPSVYTDEEIKRLLLHLAKRESVNKLRDYAMVLLKWIQKPLSSHTNILTLFLCLLQNPNSIFSLESISKLFITISHNPLILFLIYAFIYMKFTSFYFKNCSKCFNLYIIKEVF